VSLLQPPTADTCQTALILDAQQAPARLPVADTSVVEHVVVVDAQLSGAPGPREPARMRKVYVSALGLQPVAEVSDIGSQEGEATVAVGALHEFSAFGALDGGLVGVLVVDREGALFDGACRDGCGELGGERPVSRSSGGSGDREGAKGEKSQGNGFDLHFGGDESVLSIRCREVSSVREEMTVMLWCGEGDILDEKSSALYTSSSTVRSTLDCILARR
jgi:hypothetical protein